jgi:hypothetical protein
MFSRNPRPGLRQELDRDGRLRDDVLRTWVQHHQDQVSHVRKRLNIAMEHFFLMGQTIFKVMSIFFVKEASLPKVSYPFKITFLREDLLSKFIQSFGQSHKTFCINLHTL